MVETFQFFHLLVFMLIPVALIRLPQHLTILNLKHAHALLRCFPAFSIFKVNMPLTKPVTLLKTCSCFSIPHFTSWFQHLSSHLKKKSGDTLRTICHQQSWLHSLSPKYFKYVLYFLFLKTCKILRLLTLASVVPKHITSFHNSTSVLLAMLANIFWKIPSGTSQDSSNVHASLQSSLRPTQCCSFTVDTHCFVQVSNQVKLNDILNTCCVTSPLY
jgi:hypothetical protein